MDHPLSLQSATWMSSDQLDISHSDRDGDDTRESFESSESDRPNLWIRADSTSSSRSTPVSDTSADMPANIAAVDASSKKPAAAGHGHSPGDEMQWEVVQGSHMRPPRSAQDGVCGDHAQAHAKDPAHSHGHSHNRDDDLDLDSDQLKAEPDEYDFCLEDVQPAPPPAATKRPRGRPRKPSISSAAATAAAASANKIAKARSKTGCTTCRRRKKKCDETKPVCRNCEKNAVVCEGYKEKRVWQSGRERAQNELRKTQPPLNITMQPLFKGMETREDRLFWTYYRDHVSSIFTAEYNHENPFYTIVVPLATNHEAMMHSVLSLASRHMKFDSPQVQKLLRRNSKVTPDELRISGSFHNSEALRRLSHGVYHDMSIRMSKNSDDWNAPDALAAHYAQMLFLVLESLAEGQPDGSQRPHYEAFLYMLSRWPPLEPEFYSFIAEIFFHHIYADDLLYCPLQQKPRLVVGDFVPTMPIAPARMIGIADGLFNCLTQITTMRIGIRSRLQGGIDHRVDYDSLFRASDIEIQIRDWRPTWDAGDSRDRVTLLYKQMAWLYLKTTIYPPCSQPHMLLHLRLQLQARLQTRIQPPQQQPPPPPLPMSLPLPLHAQPDNESALHSGSTTCASSPVLEGMESAATDMKTLAHIEALIPAANNFSNPRRHSIANPSLASGSRPWLPKFVSFPEHETTNVFDAFSAFDPSDAATTTATTTTTRPSRASPPPVHRPTDTELGISLAVQESLALLESFAADDRCQTLLLVPCVIVGTACYAPADQERIRTAIRAIHTFTGLRNTMLALELLNKVWQLMEDGNFQAAWDWQAVAAELRIQHLF